VIGAVRGYALVAVLVIIGMTLLGLSIMNEYDIPYRFGIMLLFMGFGFGSLTTVICHVMIVGLRTKRPE
jgi:hypothetical protein